MADSKVQDLVKRTITNLAQITGVRFWSGKTGELNALGVELSELLTSAVVPSSGAADYLILTPAGFAASLATIYARGIVQLAGTTQVAAKVSDNVLTAASQVNMQAQWKKDFFVKNQYAPVTAITDSDDWNTMKTISYQVSGSKSLSGGSIGNSLYLHPLELEAVSRSFSDIYISFLYKVDSIIIHATEYIDMPAGSVKSLSYGSGVTLVLDAYNHVIRIYASSGTFASVSATINAIIR